MNRFRTEILEVSGSKDYMDMWVAFRGREGELVDLVKLLNQRLFDLTPNQSFAADIVSENPGVYGAVQSNGRALLYDQTDSAAGNGVPDQDFEAAYDSYDSMAADDFVVPATGWSIETVNTVGTTGTSPAPLVDISINADNAGVPGAPMPGCDYPGLIPTADVGGSLTLTLAPVCDLTVAGTYWVVIQVNQDFAVNGQHFWSNRTVQSGNSSVWQNPVDGFATGCTTWTDPITCGIGGGASPDLLFSLEGVVLPVELMSFDVE